MATYKSERYSTIPEGHYIFKVEGVDFNKVNGKTRVMLSNVDNPKQKHSEFYNLGKETAPNQGAVNAYGWLVRVCMNDEDLDEWSPTIIKGCVFQADIEHDQFTNSEGVTKTYAHIRNLEAVDEVPQKAEPKPTPTPAPAKETEDSAEDILAFLEGLG